MDFVLLVALFLQELPFKKKVGDVLPKPFCIYNKEIYIQTPIMLMLVQSSDGKDQRLC